MLPLLAAAPIVVILAGMGALRWSAAAAGTLGVAVAVALALAFFDLGGAAGVARGAAAAGAGAEALHAMATILWIILPALAIYEFQRRAGAIDRIRDALAGLTDDRRLQALLIAWFFGLFMEGAAGFGTPVALAAPLLVGLGFPPVRAVALALVGHAAGVSFGAVGTPTLTQVEITGLDARTLAGWVAGLHAALGAILLLVVARLAGDGPLRRGDLGWVVAAGVAFFVPSLVLAVFAGPELPSLGGAMVGGAAFVGLLWWRRRGAATGGAVPWPPLADLAPYLVILGLVLASRLVPEVRAALVAVELGWSLPGGFRGVFQPFFHPGTMLMLGLLVGAGVTGRGGLVAGAVGAALVRMGPVAAALLFMLVLSRVMVHAGMIAALAEAAAGAGAAWPLLAPAIGVLGTFVTGSATASNILFTEFQVSTAAALALSPVVMVAAQGFGAAIGNVVAPHNIIAGCATVGLKGHEGEILARTVLPCLVYTLAGGAAVLGAVAILGPG
jgi:lactate permease